MLHARGWRGMPQPTRLAWRACTWERRQHVGAESVGGWRERQVLLLLSGCAPARPPWCWRRWAMVAAESVAKPAPKPAPKKEAGTRVTLRDQIPGAALRLSSLFFFLLRW